MWAHPADIAVQNEIHLLRSKGRCLIVITILHCSSIWISIVFYGLIARDSQFQCTCCCSSARGCELHCLGFPRLVVVNQFVVVIVISPSALKMQRSCRWVNNTCGYVLYVCMLIVLHCRRPAVRTCVSLLKWALVSLVDVDEEEEELAVPRRGMPEKCKFWPNCKNGDDCPYFHPSTPCR